MAAELGLSTGHACAPRTDCTCLFIHIFSQAALTHLWTQMVVLNGFRITVHVSSGDVCTHGLFQCVGVASG